MNLMNLMQQFKQSNDPMQIIKSQMDSNPIMAKAYQMVNGKSPDEIMRIAENLAKSQGTTIQDLKRQMGLP